METWTESNCTIEHEGRKFTSGGAHIDPVYLIGYPASPEGYQPTAGVRCNGGPLCDWHGNVIGSWRATRSWPVRSWIGSRMFQIYATVQGRTYTGRGFGTGMLFRGRRIASELRAEGFAKVKRI